MNISMRGAALFVTLLAAFSVQAQTLDELPAAALDYAHATWGGDAPGKREAVAGAGNFDVELLL